MFNAEYKKNHKKIPSNTLSMGNRSRSTVTFTGFKHALSHHLHNEQEKKPNPSHIRIKSAVKIGPIVKNTQNKGIQKLHLGKVSKPKIITPHQIRNNPWGDRKPIHESIIPEKGLCQIINMGLLPKNLNFAQILNKTYRVPQIIDQKEEQREERDFFTTDILQLQHKSQAQKQSKTSQQENKSKSKRKIKKVKQIQSKKSLKEIIDIPQPKVILQISNQKIEKNQAYYNFDHKMREEGMDITFKFFINKMQQFSEKYKLKKFQFQPLIDETKKMTDYLLYKQIVNHNILGIYKAMQGGKEKQIRTIMKMFISRITYKKALRDLLKIEDIKRFYKIKKYYEEMTAKRTDYLKFKLASFAQNQRRFMEEKPQFRTQVHIIAQNTTNVPHQKSFYKMNERNNIQLTRLFSTKPEHLVIILNNDSIQIQPWSKLIRRIPGYHPSSLTLQTHLHKYQVKNIDEIYYGLKKKNVDLVKKLQKDHLPVMIPSSFSITIPKICQTLNCNLFGGNFKEEDQKILQSDEVQDSQEINIQSVWQQNKIKEKNRIRLLNQLKLVNQGFENKNKIKKFFQKNHIKTPKTLYKGKDQTKEEFLRRFSEVLINEKNTNFWIFKLPDQRFSRGLGFLETDSIKILKEKKKKTTTTKQDIEQVNKYIETIILDKVFLPHDSLLDRSQFFHAFLQKQGFIEQFIEQCENCAIFGSMKVNGQFEMLGSYSKIYTNQYVNCAGVYPADQVNIQLIQTVDKLTKNLFEEGFIGYVTFQTLYHKATKQFYFIDMVPYLQKYSSLYFMYSAYFQAQLSYQQITILQEFHQKNVKKLPGSKSIIYCPFIDNNGNKFNDFKDFEEACESRKLIFNGKQLQGIQFLYLNLEESLPDCLSIFCLASDQRSALKYCLDGLNFLIQVGDKVNKFDKRKQRNEKTDCLYINDIIWKLREIKKSLDSKY